MLHNAAQRVLAMLAIMFLVNGDYIILILYIIIKDIILISQNEYNNIFVDFFSSAQYNGSSFLWVAYVTLPPEKRLKVAHSHAAF